MLAILKETTRSGAIVAVGARRCGIGTGQLYTWRKELLKGAMAGFVPVVTLLGGEDGSHTAYFWMYLLDVSAGWPIQW